MEQRIASGFNRCNITTNEGGSIEDEVAVMYTRDRTETTSEVFMGTTTGCAVCHDHKFDPVSQKEFYALSAFFNNTTQQPMDGNVKDTAPVIPVPMAEDRPRFDALKGEIDQERTLAEQRKESARPAFEKWMATADAKAITASVPTDGLRFAVPLNDGQGNNVTATMDGQTTKVAASAAPGWSEGQVAAKAFERQNGSTVVFPTVGDFENNQSFSCAAWVKLAPNAGGSIVARMDDHNDYRGWDMWIQGNHIATHIINKWPTDAMKIVTRETIPSGEWHHVCFTYDGGMKKESVHLYIDGVAKDTDAEADALKSTIRTTVPLKIGQRDSTSGLDETAIQDLRIYGKVLSTDEVQGLARSERVAYLLNRGAAQLSAGEKNELFGGWLNTQDSEYKTLTSKMATSQAEEMSIAQRGTVAYIAQERTQTPMAYVLFRGEYDQRRDPVAPITPAFLPAMPASYPKNRLGFAKWLFLPEQPLTARVTVNRFWQEIFGTGLVRTSEDFGTMGELPSHPELLDWLAVEFRDKNWDIKRFFKMMVMSATYRQAATVTPLKKRLDPMNRLLARGPRFRMDAEMVRDYALASSGPSGRQAGWPQCQALSTGRRVGSGRDAREQYPQLHAGYRRQALSP